MASLIRSIASRMQLPFQTDFAEFPFEMRFLRRKCLVRQADGTKQAAREAL